MAYKTITSKKAKKSIDSAFHWYNEINAKSRKKFEKELRKTYNYIEKNPFQFQIKYEATRVIFLKKFPFGIHYEVYKDTVYISAVFHTSQDSENWINK